MYLIAGTNISYDDIKFREYMAALRRLRAEIDTLPAEIRHRVLSITSDCFYNTLRAAKVLHEPLLDSEKVNTVLRTPNDYNTDIGVLESREKLFR